MTIVKCDICVNMPSSVPWTMYIVYTSTEDSDSTEPSPACNCGWCFYMIP